MDLDCWPIMTSMNWDILAVSSATPDLSLTCVSRRGERERPLRRGDRERDRDRQERSLRGEEPRGRKDGLRERPWCLRSGERWSAVSWEGLVETRNVTGGVAVDDGGTERVKSLFKSSKSNDDDTSVSKKSAQSTMVPDGQPLSYSEFIVQGKVPPLSLGVPEPPKIETEERGTQGGGGEGKQNKKPSWRETGNDGTATVRERSPGAKAAHIEKQEVRATLEGNQRAGTLSEGKRDTQREGMVSSSIPKPLGTGNSILVSPRQRGNPLLKFVRNVPWEFGDVAPDYILGQTTCALFLRDRALTVVLGAHNLKAKEKSQQKIQVKQFYKHKLNSLNKYDFDVMLLKLARNATLNNKVKVIGLPKKNGDVPDKTKCTVAGWGKKHATGEAENVLQEVTVVIENRNDCKKMWKKYVNNRMICTNFTGQKGTCQGDSGGPLLCDTKAQGIAAFTGQDCEDRTYPNVYMKIASFIPWINEIMK
ncbi:UNVERIFIED_CONTAM: hypothetical protein FKN15_069583 [Acipenser sinensis]